MPIPEAPLVEFLDLAWSQVGKGSGDLDLPDPIAFADVNYAWPKFRAETVRKIQDGDYKDTHVEIVDVPKDRLMVRPLARLQLRQRLIYDAAIYGAAHVISKAIPRAVYSYRWWRRERRILAPKRSWIDWKRDAKRFHLNHPSWLMARTDIASFYEYVDIDTLGADLASLGAPPWTVDIIRNFLRSFNNLHGVSGIPQGPDSSGILANLYLQPVDIQLKDQGFVHYRYSDDMLIFGQNWLGLRDALLKMNRTLRGRRLILSSAKTKIVDSHSILGELEDMDKDAISYGLSVGIPGSVKELRKYFDRTVSRDPVSARDLRYGLNRLKESKDDYAVSWLLANMGEVPHMARDMLSYLSRFHHAQPEIPSTVADSLMNSKLSLYPFAQQHLLIYLIHHRVAAPVVREAAWSLLRDRNVDGFVREFAARFLGLHSRLGDAARLRQEFDRESDMRVRRALLVACYESGHCTNHFLTSVQSSARPLRGTARYLKSNPALIPLPLFEEVAR
ncbi:RNA-directed DNA polymerase [Verrucosispora sp. NA02020]|uniref:RNA-directed DNA polymerase n=1 Tax=Verrucosispora sp. NA02020 TaxID=2742132 RepID=UPI0015906FB5|nr:RNA-directed DNA polymerase [Verrucosispora sp. NA02020]QKW16717.1 RNA-directed DNA polymerase [Verrucosispora sp. NA02020]